MKKSLLIIMLMATVAISYAQGIIVQFTKYITIYKDDGYYFKKEIQNQFKPGDTINLLGFEKNRDGYKFAVFNDTCACEFSYSEIPFNIESKLLKKQVPSIKEINYQLEERKKIAKKNQDAKIDSIRYDLKIKALHGKLTYKIVKKPSYGSDDSRFPSGSEVHLLGLSDDKEYAFIYNENYAKTTYIGFDPDIIIPKSLMDYLPNYEKDSDITSEKRRIEEIRKIRSAKIQEEKDANKLEEDLTPKVIESQGLKVYNSTAKPFYAKFEHDGKTFHVTPGLSLSVDPSKKKTWHFVMSISSWKRSLIIQKGARLIFKLDNGQMVTLTSLDDDSDRYGRFTLGETFYINTSFNLTPANLKLLTSHSIEKFRIELTGDIVEYVDTTGKVTKVIHKAYDKINNMLNNKIDPMLNGF